MMKSKGSDYSKMGAKSLPKSDVNGMGKKSVGNKVVIGHSPQKKQAVFKTGKTG